MIDIGPETHTVLTITKTTYHLIASVTSNHRKTLNIAKHYDNLCYISCILNHNTRRVAIFGRRLKSGTSACSLADGSAGTDAARPAPPARPTGPLFPCTGRLLNKFRVRTRLYQYGIDGDNFSLVYLYFMLVHFVYSPLFGVELQYRGTFALVLIMNWFENLINFDIFIIFDLFTILRDRNQSEITQNAPQQHKTVMYLGSGKTLAKYNYNNHVGCYQEYLINNLRIELRKLYYKKVSPKLIPKLGAPFRIYNIKEDIVKHF